MKKNIRYLISLFLFWILIFLAHRIFFVLYQLPIGSRIHQQGDLYKAFYEGIRLDISTAAGLSLLPLIIVTIYFITNHRVASAILKYLVLVLTIIYSAVAISDAGLYREWNAKLNMQALEHFKNPSEVFRTMSAGLLIPFFLLLALFTIPFYFLYQKKIHSRLIHLNPKPIGSRLLQGILFFILSVGVYIISIRGGITNNIPINQGVAYFSPDVLANDIAINPLYNIIQDATVSDAIPDSSFYKLRSNEEAHRLIADDFTVTSDSTVSILKTKRPNIVFIILESWSADNISVLGGIEGCTPQFNALSEEGLLCSRAYANAYVSDQGIPSILSAYPSASRYAVINMPAQLATLNCISEDLSGLGYSTAFMFGGDLVYGNIKGYLVQKNFGELKELSDWHQYPKGSLGVADEFLFKELITMLDKKQSPFLQCFFTTSTHRPYDYPKTDTDWKSAANDPEKGYTESANYCDKHLGKFFEQAKTKPWYSNTLFVVVADHSKNSIKQWQPSSPNHSRIPLLFVGGALKDEWRGKRIDKIVSQLDILSTLLHQMELPAEQYSASRNILNPSTPSSAYYNFFGGCGYISDSGYASVYTMNQKDINTDLKDSTEIKWHTAKAMSFQQLIYESIKGRTKL